MSLNTNTDNIMEQIINEADQVVRVDSTDQFKSMTSGMLQRIGAAKIQATGFYSAVRNGVKTVWVLN